MARPTSAIGIVIKRMTSREAPPSSSSEIGIDSGVGNSAGATVAVGAGVGAGVAVGVNSGVGAVTASKTKLENPGVSKVKKTVSPSTTTTGSKD